MLNHRLIKEVEILLNETEGYEDALQYTAEIAKDLGIKEEEVIDEIKKQCLDDDRR